MFGEDTLTQKKKKEKEKKERWGSPGALRFYQGLSTDMQSYLSNSADIQRTGPAKKGKIIHYKDGFIKGSAS